MSQDFKFKYEEMRDNDPTDSDDATGTLDGHRYSGVSHVRNLGFVWQDGKRLFLNYSYLVSCEYDPSANTILISFTTHAIKIKGVQLQSLFEELMSHLPRLIICKDARYNDITSETEAIVNEINITEK